MKFLKRKTKRNGRKGNQQTNHSTKNSSTDGTTIHRSTSSFIIELPTHISVHRMKRCCKRTERRHTWVMLPQGMLDTLRITTAVGYATICLNTTIRRYKGGDNMWDTMGYDAICTTNAPAWREKQDRSTESAGPSPPAVCPHLLPVCPSPHMTNTSLPGVSYTSMYHLFLYNQETTVVSVHRFPFFTISIKFLCPRCYCCTEGTAVHISLAPGAARQG